MNIYELQARKTLNNDEFDAIRDLAELCNKHESIQLKLNWNMLKERSGEKTNDFLYYENGQLVGFIGMYQFRSTEVEVSGMVHPEHRRKGIFGEMVRVVKQESVSRNIPKLIFICQHGSLSGKSFMETIGAKYSFSEHWMQLEEPAYGASDGKNGSSITLRSAEPRDGDVILQLTVAGFDITESDARKYIEKNRNSPTNQIFIADLRREDGSLLSIGKINVRLDAGKAFIYGFCVKPDYRGRGYGRVILSESIEAIKAQNETASIALEVAASNERALGLYESCGFRVLNANDYFDLVSADEKQ